MTKGVHYMQEVHLIKVNGVVVDVVYRAGYAQTVRWQHMDEDPKLGSDDVTIEKWRVK